jgi:hypothetical protein
LFHDAETYLIGVNPTDLAIGDADLDAMPDIIAVNGDDNTASILINLGGGAFGPAQTLPVGAGPLSVEAADLDNDGVEDLAVVDEDLVLGRVVHVFQNTGQNPGDLSFGIPVAFDLDADPNFVLSADFDENFFNDLVTVNEDPDDPDTGSVSVLLNRPPCPADADLNGQVNVEDFLLILEQWGSCDNCAQCQWDVNNDCVVDVLDFLAILAAWGPCP